MGKPIRIGRKAFIFIMISGLLCAAAVRAEEIRHVRDIIWAWGNPEMAKPGPHSPATVATASPIARAGLLGARLFYSRRRSLEFGGLRAVTPT